MTTIYSVDEVAKRFGWTTGYIRQLAISGELKGKRFGNANRGTWVFAEDDVAEFASKERRSRGRPKKAKGDIENEPVEYSMYPVSVSVYLLEKEVIALREENAALLRMMLPLDTTVSRDEAPHVTPS